MKKLVELLRDPIWQGIGVLIAIIAIFLSTSNSKSNEISIIPHETFKNLAEYFPDSKIKFTIEGETSNLSNLYYRYFSIYNTSNLSFKADDFKKKISVKPKNSNIEIVLVSPCINQKTPREIANTSNPQFNWSKFGQGWELEPELLNSEEGGCMIMIVRNLSKDQADINEDDFLWDGRIVGSSLKTYSSVEAYSKVNARMTDYLQVEVTFESRGVIWFLVLEFFLFIVPLYIATKLKLKSLSNIKSTYIFAFLSITTSEILISKFINGVEQNPVVWPLLIMHLIVFVYLAKKAFEISKVQFP